MPTRPEPQAPHHLGSTLANLPTTRRELLLAIKKRGEARAETLAEALGITVSAVRQHLTAMGADALVAHRELKGGPGRPKFSFRLTPTAEALFPRTYSELTNELLEYVESEDPTLVSRIFERRSQRRIESARERLAGLSFQERVYELTRQLDEDGYLADCQAQPDGSVIITEHNCAVLGVAQRYGHACSSEIDFLRAALPDAEIERTAHIVSGAFACTYVVRPRP